MTVRVLVASTVFHKAKRLEKPLRAAGFHVIIATSGSDGVALCRRGMADLAILDALQPDLDGYAFCRAVKAEPTLRHLPLGLITAGTEPWQRLRSIEAGADECFSCPIVDTPFLMRMRSLDALRNLTDSMRRMSAIAGLGEPAAKADQAQVLVLDPESRSRERLEEILSPEFRVVASSQADHAIAEMSGKTIGVVLCDLNRIGGSRPASALLSQQLRLASLSGGIRLIGIASHGDDVLAGPLNGSPDDILLRPIDRSEALARVRIAARKHALAMEIKTLEARLEARMRRPLPVDSMPPSRLAA
jgi:two-component system, cell cycle response regulator